MKTWEDRFDKRFGFGVFIHAQNDITLDKIQLFDFIRGERKRVKREVLNQTKKNIDKHKCDFNFDFEKQKFKHKSYVALEDILKELEEK